MATTTSRFEDVASTAAETVTATTDYVTKTADKLREDFGDTERRARQLVEEYPLTCFAGAVLAGYLVGRIASRL
jgi:hypothetical protein